MQGVTKIIACQMGTDGNQAVRKAALGARTPPVLSKRVGGKATERGSLRLCLTPSPLKYKIRWPVTQWELHTFSFDPTQGTHPLTQQQC